jgi:integrase
MRDEESAVPDRRIRACLYHASHLLRAGVSANVVSERLGHSAIGITLDTYSHILAGMQEHAAARMNLRIADAIGEYAKQIT